MSFVALIEQMEKLPAEVFAAVCEVKAVDTAERSCELSPLDGGANIFSARIQASLSLSEGLAILPAVGSHVLAVYLSKDTAAIVGFSELDRLEIRKGTARIEFEDEIEISKDQTTIKVASSGIEISRGGDDLNSILRDLVTAIQAITVTCAAPGSPSSPPINLAAFTPITTRINTLLN